MFSCSIFCASQNFAESFYNERIFVMNNFKKRFIALSSLIAIVVAAFAGCAEKNNTPSLTDEEKKELSKDSLTFNYDTNSDSSDNSLDSADPTDADPKNTTSSSEEYYVVTDAKGQPVTEFVTVTQANGQPATEVVEATKADGQKETDSSGSVVTNIVPATSAVTVTAKGSSNNNNTQTTTSSSYKSNMVNCNAWWLDVSQEKDFTFNDYFIEVKFEIKKDIPDGKYPITITEPQFSNIKALSATYPENVIDGYVYVSQDAEQQNVDDGGKFTVIAESASGKQGDTVTVRFKMLNNPGLCAMNFNFEYDKNALTIVDAYSVGEFDKIANTSLTY